MTKREQERCDAALSYLKDSKLDPPQVAKASRYFIAGAIWAENNMLEEAIKWIKENFSNYVPPYDINRDKFISDFCEAMEDYI